MAEGRVRHLPHESVLYRVVREHLAGLLRDAGDHGGFPPFIEQSFSAYLDCGIPERGCIRLHCDHCGHDAVVAFSCKRRGVCPSCSARAMGEGAANLVDHVLPNAPYRQWVVSYPFELNGILAFQPEVCSAVEGLVMRMVAQFMRGKSGGGQAGGVLVRHRFGSSINLHIHAHLLVVDGTYEVVDGKVRFRAAPGLTAQELADFAARLHARLWRLLQRRGALPARADDDGGNLQLPLGALGSCAQAAMRHGARARQGPALAVVEEEEVERPSSGLTANVGGMSVYASGVVVAGQRDVLEKLCRYLLRGPLTLGRLAQRPDGMVTYRLKKPDKRGNTVLVLSPRELMMRLCSLIPAPRHHVRKAFGILAAGARNRKLVVPSPAVGRRSACEEQSEAEAASPPTRPPVHHAVPWAELLKRVWGVDALKCGRCGQQMRAVALIKDPVQAARLCGGTGDTTVHPRATGPPDDGWEASAVA